MLPDNILEVLLEKIINNWRKVYGSILGFIVGLTVNSINVSLNKSSCLLLLSLIGNQISSFTKKMKKTIINRLKED